MTIGIGVINSNHSAIFTNRILNRESRVNNKSLHKLSSGLRITRAADDAAGLAVSEKMRGQINGLEQARTNTENAVSMVQTAEGVLDVANSIIVRMRNLSVQAANDNYTNSDRMQMQEELDQLIDQVDRVANYTEFNTKALLNGNTIGISQSQDTRVSSADVVGEVTDADYMITVLAAGGASNVHGTVKLTDTNDDGVENLEDAGITGRAELHVEIDGSTRIIDVEEKDTLYDVVTKINERNVGVLAGLSADGDAVTMTSVYSGSKYNINFGDDPDGVALKLGLFGGNDESKTKKMTVEDSAGNSYRAFTTGTDTIISIANVTQQPMFPTRPGRNNEAGGYVQSLGVFRSDSRIFTEKELSSPIGGESGGPPPPPLGNPDLSESDLLKGLVIRIDGQINYGWDERDSNSPEPYIANWPEDPNSAGYKKYSPEVPESKELVGTDDNSWKSITQTQLRIRSNKQQFQVGANEGELFGASFGNITPENLGLAVKLQSDGKINLNRTDYSTGTRGAGPLYQMNASIQTQSSAENTLGKIDNALEQISLQRTALGALQNSLEKTHEYLNENRLHESESRIRDLDMAKESISYAKSKILIQSGTSMLAQANTKHETVLTLLN
ncbi:MAG: flagellin [Candidatus Muiribacteriota bacterium]